LEHEILLPEDPIVAPSVPTTKMIMLPEEALEMAEALIVAAENPDRNVSGRDAKSGMAVILVVRPPDWRGWRKWAQ
jgi:hypothetical protein